MIYDMQGKHHLAGFPLWYRNSSGLHDIYGHGRVKSFSNRISTSHDISTRPGTGHQRTTLPILRSRGLSKWGKFLNPWTFPNHVYIIIYIHIVSFLKWWYPQIIHLTFGFSIFNQPSSYWDIPIYLGKL